MGVRFLARQPDALTTGAGSDVRVVDTHVDLSIFGVDVTTALGGVLVNILHEAVSRVRVLCGN